VDAPWRTISYGLNQLFPGDVLTVRGGTYRLAEEDVARIVRTRAVTVQAAPGEQVVVLGSVSTAGRTWQRYSLELWRLDASFLEEDPLGLFIQTIRIDHVNNSANGHANVELLTRQDTWTKADANGAGCDEDNSGCYIYLYPPSGVDPNNQVYEVSQVNLLSVEADDVTVRGFVSRYMQPNHIDASAENVLIEDNAFFFSTGREEGALAISLIGADGAVLVGNTFRDATSWSDTGAAILVDGPNPTEPVIIEQNSFTDISGIAAVSSLQGTNDVVVRNNIFSDGTIGVQAAAGSENWLVYGNIFEDVSSGVLLSGPGREHVIRNNLFRGGFAGVEIWDDDNVGHRITDNIFSQSMIGIYMNNGGSSVRREVEDFLPAFTADYNLYDSVIWGAYHIWKDDTGDPTWGVSLIREEFAGLFGYDSNGVTGNPQFGSGYGMRPI
jgi:hypothetical protein